LTIGCGEKKALPEGVVEETAAFTGAAELPLSGSFAFPDSTPAPCVLILSDSGPLDRDGNEQSIVRTGVYSDLAHQLALNGISTFRYDKRTSSAMKDHAPEDSADVSSHISWDNQLEDARLAFEEMASHPSCSSASILGHGEGGLFALSLDSSVDAKALVLAAVTARDASETMLATIEARIKRSVTKQEKQDEIMDDARRGLIRVKATGKMPRSLPRELFGVFPTGAGRLLQTILLLDPIELAKQTNSPTLVLHPEMDSTLSKELDADALLAALSGRTSVQKLVVLDNTSHHLKSAKAKTERGTIGPVKPEAAKAIADFIIDHTS
jgi:alpha-beta hydrolase superfamily lysophospholipase